MFKKENWEIPPTQAPWRPIKPIVSDAVEYTVLSYSSLDSLIREVNRMIKDGWKPLGGIASARESYAYFYQAMIKE